MVKEGSARKCSKCEEYGHNSRTCNAMDKSFKLFGVNILGKHQKLIKESPRLPTLGSSLDNNSQVFDSRYLSEASNNESRETRSGNPSTGAEERKILSGLEKLRKGDWTVEEHKFFLSGLKELGTGRWKAIAEQFVTTRTPTQVASHAQKYFLRKSSNQKRKRAGNSVFDVSLQGSVLESPESSEVPLKSSSPATSSSKFPLESTKEIQKNEGTQAEIMNHFRQPWCNNHVAHPPPIAAYRTPSYSEMQYMAAFSGNGRTMVPKLDPKIAMMMPNYQYFGYGFMPYSYSTSAPIRAHLLEY